MYIFRPITVNGTNNRDWSIFRTPPTPPISMLRVLCVRSLGKLWGTVFATTLRWGDGGRKEISITMPWLVSNSACLDYLSRGRTRHRLISLK